MSTETARASVQAALSRIAPEVDLDDVDPAADLREEADLDSLDFLSLVEALAADPGVEIPESDYARVRSLDDLVGYLATHGA
ncbi:MAG: acyl carrier protein [Candidatus Nanopelagicales bacterium]